ncbi:MAG: PHP domain-containing protein [bacterium]|nr:PHP domain-containing protein [bacterium]
MIEKLGVAVLHAHTNHYTERDRSDGRISPIKCLELAVETGVNVLAITDHDKIAGAIEALEEAESQHLPISVVVGTEVTTAQGHLLVLFANKEIPTMLSLRDSIRLAHEQDALAIAPHVGVGPIGSIRPQTIIRLFKSGPKNEQLDGLEVLHPNYSRKQAEISTALATSCHLAQIGSNDDHFNGIGRGFVTLFPGETAADLKESIINRGTLAVRSEWPLIDVPLKDRMGQLLEGLACGFTRKLRRTPVLVSTVVALQLEEIDKLLKYLK